MRRLSNQDMKEYSVQLGKYWAPQHTLFPASTAIVFPDLLVFVNLYISNFQRKKTTKTRLLKIRSVIKK